METRFLLTDVTAVEAEDADVEPSGRRRLGWYRIAQHVARTALTLAILGAVTYAVVKQWPDVKHTLSSLAWQSVALSTVMILVGLGAQTLAFRAALSDVEHRVAVRTASQIYLIGLLAKYLPGSLWSYPLQMELGRRAGVPRSRAFLASVVTLGLSTTAALALGVFGLPALRQVDPVTRVLVLCLVPAAFACAHPRVLTWLVQRFLKVVRRPPLDAPITWRGVGTVIGWCTMSWLAFGVHLWLLANAQASPGLGGLIPWPWPSQPASSPSCPLPVSAYARRSWRPRCCRTYRLGWPSASRWPRA